MMRRIMLLEDRLPIFLFEEEEDESDRCDPFVERCYDIYQQIIKEEGGWGND
jgi:hypothetical protein